MDLRLQLKRGMEGGVIRNIKSGNLDAARLRSAADCKPSTIRVCKDCRDALCDADCKNGLYPHGRRLQSRHAARIRDPDSDIRVKRHAVINVHET